MIAVAVASAAAFVGVPPDVAVAGENDAVQVDVAPLESEDLDVFLGDTASPVMESEPGTPLDSSAIAELADEPTSIAPSDFDLSKATLISRDEMSDRYQDEDGHKWAVISPSPKNALDE